MRHMPWACCPRPRGSAELLLRPGHRPARRNPLNTWRRSATWRHLDTWRHSTPPGGTVPPTWQNSTAWRYSATWQHGMPPDSTGATWSHSATWPHSTTWRHLDTHLAASDLWPREQLTWGRPTQPRAHLSAAVRGESSA